VQALRLIFADGDLTLMWKERFGHKPQVLRGKVVWITGSSMGMGEHLAYEMVKAGCRVVLSARSVQLLQDIKQKCLTYGKVKEEDILVLPLDIVDIASHKEATEKVLKTFGQIDVLVNNAGRSQRAWAIETDLAVDREMIELNVIGQMSLTKSVLPHMIERQSGHIVVTSSLAGKMGVPYSATYCLTKFAVQGWFQSLAFEMVDKNIAVTIICPGPVVSNLPAVAFTGTSGKVHGATTEKDKNRMSTERCAELMSISIANKLHEVWIARQPVLIFMYICQYLPTLGFRLLKTIGIKQIMKMREGQ